MAKKTKATRSTQKCDPKSGLLNILARRQEKSAVDEIFHELIDLNSMPSTCSRNPPSTKTSSNVSSSPVPSMPSALTRKMCRFTSMNLSVRAIFTAFRKSIWKDWPATSPLRKAKNPSASASATLMKTSMTRSSTKRAWPNTCLHGTFAI